MKRLLVFVMLLIGIPAMGQSTYRNFFTTNHNPIVDVVAGSNTVVTPSTIGVNQRRYTVSSTAQNVTTNNIQFTTNFYAISSTILNLTNNYLYTTNVYAETITNVNIRTVDLTAHKGSVVNLYVGDATFTNQIYFQTNYWSGPTNTIDLSKHDQYYATFTPMSVTGFISKSNSVSEGVVLTITNAASTNVSLYFPGGITPASLTSGTVVTNSTMSIFSIRYHPLAGTNAIPRSLGG